MTIVKSGPAKTGPAGRFLRLWLSTFTVALQFSKNVHVLKFRVETFQTGRQFPKIIWLEILKRESYYTQNFQNYGSSQERITLCIPEYQYPVTFP